MKYPAIAMSMKPAEEAASWNASTRPRLSPIGAMQSVVALADRVAVGDISVLILGETGVGKEVLADHVHAMSRRAAGPMVKVNCTAMPDQLLESELFGHEKGAFTGALIAKPGLIEQADGGTVFLDEIGELSATTQAKLLRVIEQREILRVGALKPRSLDVRFVAATHRDLETEVATGRFREDLYFRIAGVTLQMPALRDRVDEIVPLAERFAAGAARSLGRPTPSITAEAQDQLRAYSWPGNVRELRNAIERATLLCDGVIEVGHLPRPRLARGTTPPPMGDACLEGVRARAELLERQAIERALALTNGNQTEAARHLGISRRTLTNKLNAHAFDRPRKRR